MQKNSLKFVIDMALFIDITTIAMLGLMLGFVIPRGSGTGAATFMGLTRHQWGDIHLTLSLVLLVLLVFHLWFNWTWICQSAQRYLGTRWRRMLWIASGAWFAVILIAWVVVRI